MMYIKRLVNLFLVIPASTLVLGGIAHLSVFRKWAAGRGLPDHPSCCSPNVSIWTPPRLQTTRFWF
jgi:hypothetical protein